MVSFEHTNGSVEVTLASEAFGSEPAIVFVLGSETLILNWNRKASPE